MKSCKNLNKTEIPEIPEIPPPILEAASNGKLVVFIGAGVSRLLGCPSWQELAEKCLKYLYDQKYISYLEYEYLKRLDPRKLLSICKNFCKKKNLPEPPIKEFLKAREEKYKKFKDIYDLIYSWNIIFITTNFDEYLDEAAQKPMPQPMIDNNVNLPPLYLKKDDNKRIISDPDQISISQLYTLGVVIHLHGSLTSRKLILTISDYLYHYQQEKIQTFLTKLFTKFTVLFIGYGLEEYELLEFLVHKSQIHTSNHLKSEKKEIKHYLLYPLFSWEQSMLKFYQIYYEDLNIELIFYKKDKNGYEQLYEVIKDWTPKIKNIVQPVDYLEIFKLIDEVVK